MCQMPHIQASPKNNLPQISLGIIPEILRNQGARNYLRLPFSALLEAPHFAVEYGMNGRKFLARALRILAHVTARGRFQDFI